MRRGTTLGVLLLFINFIYTLHYTVGAYINSSFLEQFISVEFIGLVFAVAALLAIVTLARIERFLVRYGNFHLALFVLALDIAALIGLTVSGIYSESIPALVPLFFFVAYYATAVFILRFSLDVYYEEETTGQGVGKTRGKILTASNFAWLISPLIFGQLLGQEEFWKIYTVATLLAIVLLVLIIFHFRNIKDASFKRVYLKGTLKEVWRKKDIFRVFTANFLLHFFFSWMVIYLPIHLHSTIGFSWEAIGFMLALTLLPYVIVDIPFGYIADNFIGEKELLQLGFLIIFTFTFPIALVSEASFWLWTLILFGARFGAATLEVMTDVYFFKKITERDANLIGFYRNSSPLSYILDRSLEVSC
ncbi:hypothetical protein CL654_01430 [bacterium]|mgnify:CR=1 FL=1|nr:hypothetical protein [bacterium]|tara:strand:+ start:25600 stop:26685 length:1086 start_codon:yes stop_codon:yes gene_type:complete